MGNLTPRQQLDALRDAEWSAFMEWRDASINLERAKQRMAEADAVYGDRERAVNRFIAQHERNSNASTPVVR